MNFYQNKIVFILFSINTILYIYKLIFSIKFINYLLNNTYYIILYFDILFTFLTNLY